MMAFDHRNGIHIDGPHRKPPPDDSLLLIAGLCFGLAVFVIGWVCS